MLFIPGVRRLPVAGDIASLSSADVLRGEEVECLGLTLLMGLTGPTVFLHFGSHHKAIDVDASGRIERSRTALTGELLAALREHTILGDSTASLPREALQLDMARAGLDAARTHGFGRALFLVRVGAQLGGYDRNQMTSYLIGVLSSTDLDLIGVGDSSESTVVLYGQSNFTAVVSEALATSTTATIISVHDADLELATAFGSAAVYERLLRGRGAR
jgi:2-dehydro-3-deoxygalactonokinase